MKAPAKGIFGGGTINGIVTMPWDKNFPLFEDDDDLIRRIFNIPSGAVTNGTGTPLDGTPLVVNPTKPIVPSGNGGQNSNTGKDKNGNNSQAQNVGKNKNITNGFGMDQDINEILGIKNPKKPIVVPVIVDPTKCVKDPNSCGAKD